MAGSRNPPRRTADGIDSLTKTEPNPPVAKAACGCRGFWIVLIVGLLYVGWLGKNWLPLPYSDKELSATVSRVWDIKTELAEHHTLPWWTPNFMCGSSYAINHSRGFYLLPWLAFSAFTDLETAGKLMALVAILASGLAMYGCARYFLKHDWAAVLAGIAYMFHPEQIIRAAGAEHMTISLFFPFIPLLWWTFARMLETGKVRDIALCALMACLSMWTDNKQAVISFLYLGAYLVYWYWPKERRQNVAGIARTFGILCGLGLTMGAIIIVPGLKETSLIKLFYGDPLTEWQKGFAFKSLFGLLDRNGVVTKDLTTSLMAKLQVTQLTSQAQADQVRRIFGLGMDAPEKYTGLVFVVIAAITILWNHRREKRRLFWFFIGMFMLSLMLANGIGSILSGNMKTFDALSDWGGPPAAIWLAIVAVIAFLVIFARRKLTTPKKWMIAGGLLAVFLIVPAFDIVANFPYFKDIRAPYAFYDGPGAFWVAILLAFFVTDVLTAEKWRRHIPKIVAGVAVLLLLDFWAYQKPTWDNGVPGTTITNLQAAYSSLKSDKDWVKTYSISGRYFHLLGPMYSGKPQVYEAFYNWQSPLGIGLLNQVGGGGRELLDLLGARYIVLDKTDPGMRQQTQMFAAYRQAFPTQVENEDFLVLRNEGARPYVSADAVKCLYVGDIHKSAPIALALSARYYTLVQSRAASVADLSALERGEYAQIYDATSQPIPPPVASRPLDVLNVSLTRENHQHVLMNLTAVKPCVLVINESWYPYWHADVDGQATEVLRVDCGLIGLEVGPGPHVIKLHYDTPPIYAACGVVSGVGLLVCLGLIVVTTFRKPAQT